ncbi:MAG TPA: hypothetical protein VGJ72_07510 [Polaromonas sp.]|jgi:hypothetical protein
MSLVGEATGVAGLLGKVWDWYQERRDPAYLSAKRLIRAFEAHGVSRQQIIRVLPPQVLQAKPELTMADFSLPKKLKPKLTTQLLDWAAEYLNVQRAWFDGVDTRPHMVVDRYKFPAAYRDWLQERQVQVPNAHRMVCVWKGQGQPLGADGCGVGPLCLVYEETSDGLDGMEFSRYWLLSNEWPLNHAPCVENMVAAIAVAKSVGILVTGRDVPLDKLLRLEAGKMLLPEVAAHTRGGWHPEDLVSPLPGKDTPWRQAVWRGAQGWLGRHP